MIIDMIIDNIIYVCKGDVQFKETKASWMDSFDYWKNHLGDYVQDAIVALDNDDWKGFKASMIDYMKDNGYEGSWTYNQFKRLSLKKISECFV